jgi:hypothetical protein
MWIALTMILMLGLPAGHQAAAQPATMPVAEVKPGMRGVGKTVISGQRIEEFEFEVMDVLQAGGGPIGADRLIMFRMFGPLVERTGGSAAGMSGSPMYINGRLIGALSAAFIWQTPRRDIALATPIHEMLKVLERRAPGARAPVYRATRPHVIGGRVVDQVVVAPDPLLVRPLVAALPPGVAVATPATIAFSRGLTPRANRILADALAPMGYEILQGHGGRADFAAQPIEPGSSIGIQQIRGDVDFGGICTVTMRVANRILVCGHPWDNTGDVEYILTASEIVSVVRTLPRPFKVGNLGEIIGLVDQDRGAAVTATLGRLPRLFNVRVVVTDQDNGSRIQVGAQMVRRRDMARLFAPLVALSAIERVRNQARGEGTAITKLTLRAQGLPSPIVRENTFYSAHDVATAAVLDIVGAMELAFYNDLRPLVPVDLTVETVLTTKRQTALIVDAEVPSREITPGSVLRVRVTLRPYLSETTVTRTVEVPVPRDFPRGPAHVEVRSAGVDTPGIPVEVQLVRALIGEPVPWGVDSLDTALRLFERFGKNTDLFVRIQPFGLPATATDFTRFDVRAGRTQPTDWVIQGAERIPIVVR